MARDGIIRIDPYALAERADMDDLTSLSDARIELWEAERAVREAKHDLDALIARLSGRCSMVYCDHPETSGWQCDVCRAFVPMDDEIIDWNDSYNVRSADDAGVAELVTADHASAYLLTVKRRRWL